LRESRRLLLYAFEKKKKWGGKKRSRWMIHREQELEKNKRDGEDI
jgi:hypothetical protein